MPSSLKRRVGKLEAGSELALPLHLPLDQWTDEQLQAVAAPGHVGPLSDQELAVIVARGRGATKGVP